MRLKSLAARPINSTQRFLLLLVLIFILASCGKEDTAEVGKQAKAYVQPTGIELSMEDGFYHSDNYGFFTSLITILDKMSSFVANQIANMKLGMIRLLWKNVAILT